MQTRQGFTFIESLFSLALLGVMVTAFLSVAWNILEVSTLGERFQASQLELTRVGERINFLIRNADSLDEMTESSLTLGVAGSSEVIRIGLENGNLEIEQGGDTVRVTGDKLGISGLQFSVYTMPGTSARFISYEITGSSRIGADNFSAMLRGGAEIRSLTRP